MGNQSFQGGKEKRKIFYDEREWRYIQSKAKVELFFGIKKQEALKRIKPYSYRMTFDYNFIEYIMIESEDYFSDILKELRKISKKSGFNFETFVSKLITANQIMRDF